MSTPGIRRGGLAGGGALGAVSVLLWLGAHSPVGAAEPATGETLDPEALVAAARLSPEERDAMMRGEIVDFTADDLTDADVFAGLASYFDAPLAAVLDALGRAANAAAGDPGIPATIHELEPTGPFPEVAFGAADRAEAAAMLAFSGGGEFNMSESEIADLQGLGIAAPLDDRELKAFSEAYRRILQQRFEAYRRAGLAAIAPYDRGGGEQLDPSVHLAAVTRDAGAFLGRYMPELWKELEHFPSVPARTEAFMLIHKPREGRKVYVLAHRLGERRGGHAVVVHREYYVGHGYDATQVIISCLEYHQGTLVAVATDVITDQVAGFGSSVKHRIGRARVRSASEPILVELRRLVEPSLRAASE